MKLPIVAPCLWIPFYFLWIKWIVFGVWLLRKRPNCARIQFHFHFQMPRAGYDMCWRLESHSGACYPSVQSSKLSVSFTIYSFILHSSRLFAESHAYAIISVEILWCTYKISFINDPSCRMITQCHKTFRQTYEIRVSLSMPNPPHAHCVKNI